MPPLIVDIETVPTAAALLLPYPDAERQPPSNYKAEEAIAKWRASDKAKWEEERTKECSLNPRLGRVVCLGYSLDGETDALIAESEADEQDVIERFWTLAQNANGNIVTWNGVWDLRFLVIRSLSLGITPTLSSSVIRSWFRKYATYPHFDCRAVITNWEPYRAGEGLDVWAEFLGCVGKTDGLSGKDVYPMYQLGHFSEIADYCKQDVASTLAVYERLAPMFGESFAA